MIAPIREHGADRFFGIGECFPLGVALGDNFGQGGDQNCKPAAFLRFENDGEAVVLGHGALLR
jgi:hypothetical protein